MATDRCGKTETALQDDLARSGAAVFVIDGMVRQRRKRGCAKADLRPGAGNAGGIRLSTSPAETRNSIAPKKSKAAWQMEIKAGHKLGKYRSHALSRTLFEPAQDLPYGDWTEM